MKTKILITALMSIGMFVAQSGEDTHTFSSQPPAFNVSNVAGNGSCGAGTGGCHSSNALDAGSGQANIDFNMGETNYTPTQTYSMSITISDPNASRFGFQLLALDASGASVGNLIGDAANSTATQTSGGFQFLNHMNAPSGAAPFTFNFQWEAPAGGSGDVTFYASANASDGNGSPMGDFIYSAELTISEGMGSAICDPTADFTVEVKVLLEAVWDGTAMGTERNALNTLPLSQPFGAIYGNYAGTEMVSGSFPVDIVDWVLVCARNADGTILAKSANLLQSDGQIVSVDGAPCVSFPGLSAGGTYHVSVHHLGHIGVMSNVALNSGDTHDFTLAESQAAGTEQLVLDNGRYTLLVGDYDGNGIVNSLDYNIWAVDNAAVNQYSAQDGDLNSVVNSLDYNYWERNRSKLGYGQAISF